MPAPSRWPAETMAECAMPPMPPCVEGTAGVCHIETRAVSGVGTRENSCEASWRRGKLASGGSFLRAQGDRVASPGGGLEHMGAFDVGDEPRRAIGASAACDVPPPHRVEIAVRSHS